MTEYWHGDKVLATQAEMLNRVVMNGFGCGSEWLASPTGDTRFNEPFRLRGVGESLRERERERSVILRGKTAGKNERG